jgi:hypothetical protein
MNYYLPNNGSVMFWVGELPYCCADAEWNKCVLAKAEHEHKDSIPGNLTIKAYKMTRNEKLSRPGYDLYNVAKGSKVVKIPIKEIR